MSRTDTGAGGDVANAGDAAARALSTAPRDEEQPDGGDGAPNLPRLGVIGWTRWFWRQLTSMRVALMLLFLLSLAAIPGSLVPQESTNPVKVSDFVAAHATLGPLYDRLGLFHVYSSVWFSAIYILLFVSLVGCIVPRAWQFAGQLRSAPPRAPRSLDRMPAYATWTTEAEPDAVLAAAREQSARAPLPRRAGRGIAGRREGLPARGRQPALPHRAVRPADRLRHRHPVEVRRQQAGGHRRRVHQQPDAVRRP